MKQTQTKKELEGALQRLNNSLLESGYKIEIGYRNNYIAIDLMNQDGGMINYLDTYDTTKQALNAVYLMCKTVELLRNPIK